MPRRSRLWPDPRVKPPLGALIDWGHRLTAGLVGCFLFNDGGGTPKNLAQPSTVTAVGTTWRANPYGLGLHIGSSDSIIVSNLINISDDFTTIVRAKVDSASGYQMVTSMNTGGGNYELRRDFGTNHWHWISSAGQEIDGTTTPNLGQFYHLAGRQIGTTTFDLYVDGVKEATGVPTKFSGATNHGIGCRPAPNNSLDGDVELVCWYKRGLTDGEIAWLYAEPYAFIAPPAPYRRYFIPAPGGISGTATLAAPASALAGVALEVVSGAASMAPPASALAGSGTQGLLPITGPGSLAFDVSAPAASGLVVVPISGAGGVAPAVSAILGFGVNGVVLGGGVRPIRRPAREPSLPEPEPITGVGRVRVPVSPLEALGRVVVLGRGLVVSQAAVIRSDAEMIIRARGGVRRRVASTRGAGHVGFPDDDAMFGMELEELI